MYQDTRKSVLLLYGQLFSTPNSVTSFDHQCHSPDLAQDDFWWFLGIKFHSQKTKICHQWKNAEESPKLLSNSRKYSQGVLRHRPTGVIWDLPGEGLTEWGFFGMVNSSMFAECVCAVNSHVLDQSPLSTDPRGIQLAATSTPHPCICFQNHPPILLTNFLTDTLLCCFPGHFPLFLYLPPTSSQHHQNATLH